MGAAEDTEEFAAYLRRLKERSGRSYGQLAQRAHLSTSTLHRYCNGKAVPVEYAPVERLARVCGATPEELVGLHRRWVRADAVRGRGDEGGTSAGAGDGDGDTGDGDGGPDEGVGDVAGEPAVPGRLRRWVWPVAALVALAVTVALAAFVGEGPGGAGGSVPRASGPGAGAGHGKGGAQASPSASVEAGQGKGRPSGAPSEAAPQGAPASRRPAPSPTAGEAEGTPLTWTAGSHVWRHGCDHRYLVDRGPSEVPPPPVAQDARGWASALGAVHGGETVVEATVRAAGAEPVVVEGVYVRVVDRRTPLGWPVYGMSNGCGGALTPAAFTVDLDAARPVAHPEDGYDGEDGTQLPATRLPYQVTADEPLVLRVEAGTERYDCEWYLEVRWSSGGRTGTLRIDDGGRPFRTSGGGEGEVYGYDWGNGAWQGSGA